MPARMIDGKFLANEVKAEVRAQVVKLRERFGRPPGLAAVLVGDNPASAIYVRNKAKACEAVGMAHWLHLLPQDVSQPELLSVIRRLNADPAVDGILVQLPLPSQIAEDAVLRAIDPAKDVDGFHPENAGLLALGQPRFVPCTPLGVWEMLKREPQPLAGRHVVILGRSNIVGKPLALLLVQKHPQANATVTLCHSQSRDWPSLLRQADVVVAAVGQPGIVTAEMLRPQAVVIDVGINRLASGKVVGDVDFASAAARVAAITPVPGGVGPMTIAMLLRNTARAMGLREQAAARL